MSRKNFNRMGQLLDELRVSMENLEDDNSQMQHRMYALRDQNEKLRKERQDLRVQNAQLVARIAQLSRKHSITNSPPKPPKAKGPPPIALHQVSTEEIHPGGEKEDSDTDYEDTTPTSSPLLPKRPLKSAALASSSPPPTPPPPRRTVQFSGCEERTFAKLASDSQDSPPSNFNKNRSESLVSTASETSKMSGSDAESPSLSRETVSSSSTGNSTGSENKEILKRFGTKRLGAIGRSQTLGLGRTLGDYSEEDEDEDDWTGNSTQIRPRVATLAIPSSNPRRKRPSTKSSHSVFHRHNSYPRRGRYKVNREHLTYLSSDVEMKIQKIVREAIGIKYGGLERATKAAITIQQAYRGYCIRKQFTEIRKKQKVTLHRQRAESVKYPNKRRLSMIGPKKYRKEKSSSGIDPMQRVLDTHRNVTTRKMSPSISRRQLLNQSKMHLGVAQTSSVSSISEEEQTNTRPHISSAPHGVEREPIEEPLADDVFSTSGESVDGGGLTVSLSADILDRGGVSSSPSIFSGLSVQTMQDLFPVQNEDVIAEDFTVDKATIGIHIFNRKPTRGIQYLVHEQIVVDDPMAVAKFICNNSLFSKEKIGEFVGEIRQDFNIAVLECMVELMDFSSKSIDDALRKFQELFRMPGEAQKIDKIMQIFAAEYFKHNEGGVIKSGDAAYVLAFAVMMLHTDLHNPAVRHHMTVQQWLSMNRGTNDDEDYPKQFLVDLYTRIQKEEFVTGRDHTNDVAEVERHLVGANLPANLCTPQRMLVLQTEVMEVKDINKRIMIKHHRRMFFLFNDMIMITKNAGGKYEYRMSISLLDVQAMQFSTPNYKHGICIQNVACGESYYCNCEKREERNRLLKSVQHAIEDLRHVEKARIRTLGSTLHTTFSDDEEGPGGGLSNSHELLNSMTMSSSMQDMRNVGRNMPSAPVAPVNRNARLPPSPLLGRKEKEVKRTSKDSGFDSPNTTSPSPNGWTTTTLAHQPPTSLEAPARPRTPDVKRHMIVIPDNKARARSVTPEPSELRALVPPDVAKKSKSLTPDALPLPVAKKRWRLGSRESKEGSSINSNSKKSKKVNRTASSKP